MLMQTEHEAEVYYNCNSLRVVVGESPATAAGVTIFHIILCRKNLLNIR